MPEDGGSELAGNPLAAFTRKLARLAPLDEADQQAIAKLPLKIEKIASGRTLVREGDLPSRCCVLLQGYVCRHRSASQGRQIVSFHFPGDILDVQHLQLPRADHNVQTITKCTVAWTPSSELRRLLHEHPRINDALWRDALIDASIFREWVLNLGRRDAKTRIAHMLCEFAIRREAAGLGSVEQFELPMTQEQIADATGLTSVHVNRVLRELDVDGAMTRRGRKIQINDWERMRQIGDFGEEYLHAAA